MENVAGRPSERAPLLPTRASVPTVVGTFALLEEGDSALSKVVRLSSVLDILILVFVVISILVTRAVIIRVIIVCVTIVIIAIVVTSSRRIETENDLMNSMAPVWRVGICQARSVLGRETAWMLSLGRLRSLARFVRRTGICLASFIRTRLCTLK